MKRLCFIFLLGIFLISIAEAREQVLATVTSDAIPGTGFLKLEVDGNNMIQRLKYDSDQGDHQVFTIPQLLCGAVIYSFKGIDILKVRLKNFDPAQSGDVELMYVKNIFSGQQGLFIAEIDRNGGLWEVSVNESTGRRPFSNMYLKKNSSLGITLGIHSIRVW